jgi:glycosyltransferase involved in cell wall biosynthesis
MTGAAPSYVGRVEQALSLVSSRIIAVSAYERDHAIALGISPARITVVPNGLRPSPVLSRDEARAQLGLNSKAFIIGFVGRLEAQKDPLAAIGVMAELAGNEIELAMIGNGALRHAAEREAAQTSAKVHFLGSREAKPLFAAFDVLLCTSRYEGMPIAFLESLNAGVPIISFPVGGADELIDEGRTGMVVEPRPECAAQAVRRLQAASHEVRQEMREACLRKAAEHTDETMGSATLDVYLEVLAGR